MGSIIDIHIHTSAYSPCSILSPEKMVQRAEQLQLDGIVITEHDKYWSKKDINDLYKKTGTDLLLMRGIELSSTGGHILVYGQRRSFDKLTPKAILTAASEPRTIALKSHPFRFLYSPETPFRILKKELGKFEALEAYNGNQDEKANLFGEKFCRKLNLTAAGGSDAHSPDMLGKYATEFDQKIENEEDFIRLLKEGKCRPVKLF